jgi:hypothetical protein
MQLNIIRMKCSNIDFWMNCWYSSSKTSIQETFDIKLSKIKQRFYDIKRDPYIEIINFEAIIERRPTEIDETSPRVLKYKSPSFM